jgi:Mrp family chromosome partitioning ATPase/formylmethanofuran dehydrogenase subunit D
MSTRNSDKYSAGTTTSSRPQVVFPTDQTDQGRPAVVRQLKNPDGSQQNLRIDSRSASTVPAPQMRRHQLDEYVNWLQNQAASPVSSSVNASDIAADTPADISTQASPQTNQRRATESGFTESGVERPFSQTSERHDAAHTNLDAASSVSRAHLPAEQFSASTSNKGDLDRILSKLDSVHFLDQDSAPAPNQAKTVNQNSTAPPLPIKMSVDDLLNSESIIRTISQAIASVLTEESEPEIERKVRERMNDVLQAETSLGHVTVRSESAQQPDSKHSLQSGDAVRIQSSHGHVAHYVDETARTEMNRLATATRPAHSTQGDSVEIRSSHGHVASRSQPTQHPLQSGDAVRVQSAHGHIAHYTDETSRTEINRLAHPAEGDSVEIRSSHGHVTSRTQPNNANENQHPLQSGDAVRVQSSHGHAAHYADEAARTEMNRLDQATAGESVEIRSSHGHVSASATPVQIAAGTNSSVSPEVVSNENVAAPHSSPNTKSNSASNEAPPVSIPMSSPAPLAEIPANVAAWDVEEFRWPKLTNHMLDAGAEAIDELAKSVLRTMITGHQRLAVTSPGRGEGTSSIAISLARCVANNGGRVLLVDADLSHPGLSADVGLGPNISWSQAIRNGMPAAEVIIRSQQSQLCVMPLAPLSPHLEWPQKLLDPLGELIQEVQSSFDLVIYDIGPATQLISELSSPSKMIDVGLIVHNGLDRARFRKTQNQLQQFGLQSLVVAQNAVHQSSVANVA